MNAIYLKKVVLLICCSLLLFSCSDSSKEPVNTGANPAPYAKGSGSFEYTDYKPLAKQPIKIYFHIPVNSNANTPVVLLFHGDERNALECRNALINKSEEFNFIILAPEFSEANYPTGDKYNLGNVYIDGDNPTASSLNPEEIWTFSIIEPLFDSFKKSMSLSANTYHIIGHSAGAQFALRFIMFKPNARLNTLVASASGWYTVPDLNTNFPYGFKKSLLENLSIDNLFAKKIHIQIGSQDNNPNSPGLRHNPLADAQGLNRLTRANYFFDFSKNKALQSNLNFQWKLSTIQALDHNFIPAINNAADLIFK